MGNNFKYMKVEEYILDYIQQRSLVEGDKLPTGNELIQLLGVSKISIQRAMRDLVEKKAVYQIRGGGSYVGPLFPKEKAITYVPLILSHGKKVTGGLDILSGVESFFKDKSYYITTHLTQKNPETERAVINQLVNNGAKYIISFPNSSEENWRFYFDHMRNGVSFVFIDHKPQNISVNLVSSDNVEGGYLATEHLIQQGYKRIGLVSMYPENSSTTLTQRYLGYQIALKKYNMELSEDYIMFSCPEQFMNQLSTMLSLTNAPDAIFAANDFAAIECLHYFKQNGIAVPNDMGIIGYDDLEITYLEHPSISSVKQQFFEQGYQAAKMMYDIIQGKHPFTETISLPVQLMPKESSLRQLVEKA
ncbi:MAG: GntR family transcriptional regulator [Clostridiales bacterium]|nr:GntR family transcriptional regulator [Clostridiales bacterium]